MDAQALKQFFPDDIAAIVASLRIAFDAGRPDLQDAEEIAFAKGFHAGLHAVELACQCRREEER